MPWKIVLDKRAYMLLGLHAYDALLSPPLCLRLSTLLSHSVLDRSSFKQHRFAGHPHPNECDVTVAQALKIAQCYLHQRALPKRSTLVNEAIPPVDHGYKACRIKLAMQVSCIIIQKRVWRSRFRAETKFLVSFLSRMKQAKKCVRAQ